MLEILKPVAEWCASGLELLGLAIITLSAIYALIAAAVFFLGRREGSALDAGRQALGSGILFGLEFFVAADIIHTVAVDLSMRTVAVLAVIVLIRTFLSFTLHVELKGRWPWQQGTTAGNG